MARGDAVGATLGECRWGGGSISWVSECQPGLSQQEEASTRGMGLDVVTRRGGTVGVVLKCSYFLTVLLVHELSLFLSLCERTWKDLL